MAPMGEPGGERLRSLDAFRGFAMASMVVVNNPGDWATVYAPLLHAEWHGWTPTDLIFPFFLWIVGVAMAFSRRASVGEAVRRALGLVGLGLFLSAYPYFDLAGLRWPGVLQKIAVAYLLVFLVRRFAGTRGEVVALVATLAGYWLLLARTPLPDGTPANLDPGTNFAAWVDRTLMAGHLWRQTGTWDPEGLLTAWPAAATVFFGLLAGRRLREAGDRAAVALRLVASGAALVAAGLVWDRWLPINKNLWTSSFVVFTAGFSALAFALFYAAIDLRGARRWARPFEVMGRNALVLFVGSGLLARTLAALDLKAPLHRALFLSWLPPYAASLAFALANLALWFVVLAWMDRRRLYFSI
jgi:predicted acyltransferase